MAHLCSDPMKEIIADGRIHIRPTHHYGLPEVLTINLEHMAATLVELLETLMQNDPRIITRYSATQHISTDITSLVTFLMAITYNHLRSILKANCPSVVASRMNTRCPIPNNIEFPSWLSATLSSIGPIRVIDGPRDKLIVYATTASTMNNFGREHSPVFSEGNYTRLMQVLREINVVMSPFPSLGAVQGSYFTTIQPVLYEYTWTFYGNVHQSHYENEDIARIALVTSDIGMTTPFESIGMTIGYVDDEATLDAVPAPKGLPAGQTADSVGAAFRVNYFGIKPAVVVAAAAVTIQDCRRGMYVIGRGTEPYYQCVLGNSIATFEILEMLRFRILRTA